MEKYGTVTKSDAPKTREKRAQHATCPVCKSLVKHVGPVTICPNCGTKPFEGTS